MPTDLNLIYTGFKANFANGMQKASKTHEQLAMMITSETSIQKYPIFDQLRGMREWVGPRKFEELKLKMLTIINKDFEQSVRVKRNDIEDDNYALYSSALESLGLASGNIWDELVFNALTTNSKWADDLDFYSTTRVYKKGSPIVNKSTAMLSLEAYKLARQTMMGYVGEAGTPLNIVPDTLVVGPANEAAARSILEASLIVIDGATTENVYKGTAKLIVSTRLVGANANKWFLMATNDPIKPIICQKRREPVLTRMDREDSEAVVKFNEFWYLSTARGEAALTVPHLIYGGGL